MKHYDYIFTGGGLAALLVLNELILKNRIQEQSILILDTSEKKENDRTWCFWDTQNTFSSITSKSWNEAYFLASHFKKTLDLKPYQYHKIDGLDFYTHCINQLKEFPNVEWKHEKVDSINELENSVQVISSEGKYIGTKVFNSITFDEGYKTSRKFPLLAQHFVGWFIKTENAVFDPERATFMDFSIDQNNNTRFMYVLPTSTTEALIEYTLFSEKLLEEEEYEDNIKLYLKNLGISSFEITAKEKGNIPMTCYPFWKKNTKNTIHIGSAGGWTKASTGYTFKKSHKNAQRLVGFLQQNKTPDFRNFQKITKFWFYDLLLIDILFQNNVLGGSIFAAMFKKRNAALIFKFLDEETTFWEDLKIILSCPKIPFLKVLFKRIFSVF